VVNHPLARLRISEIEKSPGIVIELIARIRRRGEQPLGWCSFSQLPGVTRSGSNHTMIFIPFSCAWSLTDRRPFGNRVRSTSQVPVLVQLPLFSYQPASIQK